MHQGGLGCLSLLPPSIALTIRVFEQVLLRLLSVSVSVSNFRCGTG